jgi:hypothetical protein
VRSIALASGKHLGRVDVPGEGDARFVTLLAASADGKAPVVVWRGWTGHAKGEHGEQRTHAVLELPSAKGARVLVGDQREDVSICGRPALVRASEVDPANLSLVRGASVQSLSAEEQARAVPLTAARVEGDTKVTAAPVLLARVASSAVDQRMATLTDGDPETVWSEAKTGDGRGEFVAMSVAEDVPVTSIDLVVRPAKATIADAVAPRKLFLATSEQLFAVTLPEDAWTKLGARYAVKLPAPLRTRCVAVVLDESYARGAAPKARTSLAEITAHTELDGVPLEGLVGALAGGGDRAKAAASLLARGGKAAVAATVAGYAALDDHGKELARNVIDGSPCGDKAGFYAARMIPRDDKGRARAIGATDGEAIHARDQVRRCGREAAGALAALVGDADEATRIGAARELAMLSPADAVPALLAAIAGAKDGTRRELRGALAVASKSERARDAIGEQLAAEKFGALSEVAKIDLLRAAGPALAGVDGGARALGGLAIAGAPFRTRFLLLGPAAELAQAGDSASLAFLRSALSTDADPHVRAHAAEVAAEVPALRSELVRAVDDADARVREASLGALAKGAGTAALAAAARRLGSDPWTFVRVSAARTLAAMPAGKAVDAPLGRALEDGSPLVRGEALDALAAHRAVAYREPVRAIANADREALDVRARAILALGALCDAGSLDDMTKLARRGASPMSEADQRLGAAALTALASLHPSDLAKRIAPLTEKGAPAGVREAARAALAGSGQCH